MGWVLMETKALETGELAPLTSRQVLEEIIDSSLMVWVTDHNHMAV